MIHVDPGDTVAAPRLSPAVQHPVAVTTNGEMRKGENLGGDEEARS